MSNDQQFYVFGFGFLCGVVTALLLLLGGFGRIAVVMCAAVIVLGVVAAHQLGVDLVLHVRIAMLAHAIDLPTLSIGYGSGKGLVGIVVPPRSDRRG